MSRKTGRSRARAQASSGNRGAAAAVQKPRSKAPPAVAARIRPVTFALVSWIVWGIFILTFFAATAIALERQITWYLAVDQFGYLSFARDLLSGRVFHDWPPLRALQPFLPARTDILAQTYVDEGGRLYCRYSPGFPMLLAAWIGIFGDYGAHYLNPTLYLVLLAIALVFQWRLFRSPWRAGAGTVLITLFPTLMHLWGLTLTRDISAHVCAFAGLFLLLPARGRALAPRRLFAAAIALGFAASIRPDAVLYLVPASLMIAVRLLHERRRRAGSRSPSVILRSMATGVLGLVLGMSPFLAYNWAATGNPLIPTQGMELPLLPALPPPPPKPPAAAKPPAPAAAAPESGAKVGFPPPGWHGGTYDQVQGGGLRLAHLPTTLPGIWKMLGLAYSPFLLGVIVWGAIVAAVLRPMLAAAAVSYTVVAILFFGCWPRADFRYLIGVFVFLPMLVVEGTIGTLDLVRLLWKRREPRLARGLAAVASVAFFVGAATFTAVVGVGSLASPTFLIVTVVGCVALATAATQPQRRVALLAAPALMLALVICRVQQVQADNGRRAPFQRAQMLEARANMQKLLEPGAVVITTEDVGRPAENIEFYSGAAHAMYLTDLARWRFDLPMTAARLILDRWRPYLFIPTNEPGRDEMLASLRKGLQVELVAAIPPQRAMAHFVAAPFHRGVAMELYRISWPLAEKLLREHDAGGTPTPQP